MLVLLSGLPGTGKSTIAQEVARRLPGSWLSVDPIESALLQSGIHPQQPTGLAAYVVAEALADAQLGLGQDVIIDAVNAVEEARVGWRRLAARHGTTLKIVECVCSDLALHRQRLESRKRNLPGLREPTWPEVEQRRATFVPWPEPRLLIDTVRPLETLLAQVRQYLQAV